jgi:hypothetical protein
VIQFAAMLPESGILKSHKLVWAANYIDNHNYVRFELTETELTIKPMKDKKDALKAPVKVVQPGEPCSIRLDWRANSITISVNGKMILETPGNFQGGQFGFLGNKEIRMGNFRLEGN